MATTIEQIDEWRAARSEDQVLEFKEAKNQYDNRKLFRYCVALANEGGGHLILGIEDKPPRVVVGTAAFNNPVEMASILFQTLGFHVDLEEMDYSGKRVLVFHIPSRPSGTAYKHDGVYYMRVGEELMPMSEDRLRAIFAEGQPDWLSQPAMKGCDDYALLQALDTHSFFRLLNRPYPTDIHQLHLLLANEYLIRRDGSSWTILNLGAILLANRLRDFDLDGKAVRFIVYDGSGKTRTKSDHSFERGYAAGFPDIVQYVEDRIPSNEVIERALRREVKMFPHIAVRELVANALIHQDFTASGMSVMIELYEDRLEVSNPGKPLILSDRFIDLDKSRNERLAKLMRKFGVCEEKGSGIDKVVEAAEVYQLPAPNFRENDLRTTVVLYCHKEFEDMDREDRVRACYQHCCLLFANNKRMTNQTLRERFHVHEGQAATITKIINAACQAGRIKVADPSQASTKYRRYLPYWA